MMSDNNTTPKTSLSLSSDSDILTSSELVVRSVGSNDLLAVGKRRQDTPERLHLPFLSPGIPGCSSGAD